MKQRVVVQAIIENDGKVLLLRRSQGRPGIVGKLELPGGTLVESEQPDDGMRRHLHDDAGLAITGLSVKDVLAMNNREDGDIQHILISYQVQGITLDSIVKLGQSYDEFVWMKLSAIQQVDLRDSAQLLLGLYVPASKAILTDINADIDANNTMNISRVVMYSDGGSRGNPGPSAAAFVMLDSHQNVIDHGGEYLGITTNNQAEYQGVRIGLEHAVLAHVEYVEFRIDSMLVVNQLRGIYKIKNRELWPINERIVTLMTHFKRVTFTHVPREHNQLADGLVNKLLDDHKSDIV